MSTSPLTKISKSKKQAILAKSVMPMPDNPGAAGLKSADIKAAFVKPMIDDEDSLISIIEDLICECEAVRQSFEIRLSALEAKEDN